MNNQFVLTIMMALFAILLFLGAGGGRDELSNLAARAATILLIAANVYYPSRLIILRFGTFREEADLFFKKYLNLHMVLNLLAFPAVTIHGHYAEERNVPLTASYVVFIALAIQGLMMHYRVLSDPQDRTLVIRMQRVLSAVWILLVVIGHMIL